MSPSPLLPHHLILPTRTLHSSDIALTPRSNARTAHLRPDLPTPTLITISPDRTFTFTIRTPPTAYLLKRAAGIDKGTGAPGSKPTNGSVTLKHVYEIARIKCGDEGLAAVGEEGLARQIIGTARSLGLEVVP